MAAASKCSCCCFLSRYTLPPPPSSPKTTPQHMLSYPSSPCLPASSSMLPSPLLASPACRQLSALLLDYPASQSVSLHLKLYCLPHGRGAAPARTFSIRRGELLARSRDCLGTLSSENGRIISSNNRSVSGPLEILANPGNLNKILLERLPRLELPYERYPLLVNRHQETIFASLFRSVPDIRFRRECLRMADGGTVALDWPLGGTDTELWRRPLPESASVLILLPGLTGGSNDTYVRHLLVRARRHNWHVVVFNSRGCADSPVTSPQFYSASFTEDLRQVVKHVGSRFPKSQLCAVGWSLGGNILVRYLGEEGENCLLSGAVSLCNPFNLVIADEDFHKGFNNVYDKSLARGLRKIFRKHSTLFEGIGGEYNIRKAAGAKSVRDFDDGLTRVSFGYKSVDDYYYDASSSRSITDVKIPLLCVQADDDPIAPSRGIPRVEIQENPYCLLVVTPSGGHLGWVAGAEAPFGAPWTDPLVIEYLEVIKGISKDRSSHEKSDKDGGELELIFKQTIECGNGGARGMQSIY